ncbi:metallophosphoesterase domain-containing protein [Ascosphaera apis ARSEF 7405]|uniref:Metallophosphoesterase domain-containing protein n=1 Tax=Ascosphaera apis ARSEF 7405 TaxID=392613 RepID=A0A168DJT4_9EURO|nr:metallophosphoesterase domain-containing protein [Ascosphaera apis ARSEF 7405]
MATDEVKTTFLIISDTHGQVPLEQSSPDPAHQTPFQYPLPRADVLLHAGDLSYGGHEDEHRRTVQMLKSAQAELKIVIPGNHDITLDQILFDKEGEETFASETVKPSVGKIKSLYCDKDAKEHNIVYLEHGVRTFTLNNGAEFTIFTSPHTIDPWGHHWAFGYKEGTDLFNPLSPDATCPIPDHVDILMTHGPPKHVFDQIPNGLNVGCSHLWQAVERVKPRLHVFGHIHEQWGASRFNWDEANWRDVDLSSQDRETQCRQHCVKLDVSEDGDDPMESGRETLFINTSTLTIDYEAKNAPWLVELNLSRGRANEEVRNEI